MEWQGTDNDAVYQRTKYNTTRAHRYYYVFEKSAGKWIAGRYWFSREYDYGRIIFPDSATARAYCEKIDRETVIIEGVTA